MDYEALYLVVENAETIPEAEIDEMDEIRRISEAAESMAIEPPVVFTSTT
jgi:hypothetical protein